MTGTGTNSYLVGSGEVALIDPGPDDPAHLAAILAALSPDEQIGVILVTHAHLDHSALVPRIRAATGARVLAYGSAAEGRSAVMERLAAEGLLAGGEGIDPGFQPDARLRDGDEITLGALRLQALHTPGHMGCHLCFACEDQLFSGDHAMGWSTSLVSPPDGDMTDYLAGLARLAARPWARMWPGHGAPVDAVAARLAELTAHRQSREAGILAALSSGPDTAAGLAARIYHDIPPALLPAATRNVLAHLIDLAGRSAVTPELPLTAASRFART